MLFCSVERQEALNSALEKAPPKSYLDAMAALFKWIEGVEILLESEPFYVNKPDIMEEQLAQFRVSNIRISLTSLK